MKSMVARVFKGLNPEQMVACGGKAMPQDVQGRNLKGHAFDDWVKVQVRDHRADQLAALGNAEVQLRASLAEAERQVALFTEHLRKNAERQAAIRARARV
jgi:hypothetical protein